MSNDLVGGAVAKLKTACDEAYMKYPGSCSHAVWYVRTQLLDPQAQYLQANQLVDELDANWEEVSVDDGWALAQKGVVVIGGLQKKGDHGHVIVIYPGDKKNSGGYLYPHKDKASGKTKDLMLRSHGMYPRALSTSSGSWPGARSKGDKTVWDPWADDDLFENVTFWTSP
ncbi:MAG TPA: hypothetical protein VL967_14110 [Terracidiphilus sp.]|nr:hypothetical protein [Terracidiphilus sp.]